MGAYVLMYKNRVSLQLLFVNLELLNIEGIIDVKHIVLIYIM